LSAASTGSSIAISVGRDFDMSDFWGDNAFAYHYFGHSFTSARPAFVR